MDLLFVYEKFYEPLPESVYEFKRKVNQLFPVIYDTKHASFECKRVRLGFHLFLIQGFKG